MLHDKQHSTAQDSQSNISQNKLVPIHLGKSSKRFEHETLEVNSAVGCEEEKEEDHLSKLQIGKKSQSEPLNVYTSTRRNARLSSHNLKIHCNLEMTTVIDPHGDTEEWLQKTRLYSALEESNLIKSGKLSSTEEHSLILSLEKAVLEGIAVKPSDPSFGSIFLIFDNFKDFFDELKTIGQGSSAVVKKCRERATKALKEYAVKISSYSGDEERLLQTISSFKMNKGLKHPNVVEAEALYIDLCKEKTYMILELIEGRNLLEILDKVKQFEEREAAKLFKSVLCGAQYLHSQGICHRDLKLENILIENRANLKITDLNVSKYFKDHDSYNGLKKNNYKMWTFTGTVACLPPEVFTDLEYTENIDSWSAGVMLYTMLTGYIPFFEEYQEDLMESIIHGKYKTDSPEYEKLSSEAKHFIDCLLEKDPMKRYTLLEALSHTWITLNTKEDQ